MKMLSTVAHSMYEILTITAEKAGRDSGFVKRSSKLNGSLFVQTLVFSYLANPRATMSHLVSMAATLGITITASGVFQRFGKAAADCLYQVLSAAAQRVLAAEPIAVALLRRFRSVYLQDSSTITLPPDLADVWRGCGGSTTAGNAAVKIQLQMDLVTGHLSEFKLHDGRASDHASIMGNHNFVTGALYIADLGYFRLDRLEAIATAQAFWVSRWKTGTILFDEHGRKWNDLASFLQHQGASQVDMQIELGAQKRLPCRLIGVQVPKWVADQRRRQVRKQARKKNQKVSDERLALCSWTLFLTNVPADQLSLAEVLVLGRARWQIELMFKLWKSHGQVNKSSSTHSYHVLCQVYAKMLAMIIHHWVVLINLWAYPDRSLMRAAQVVQQHAVHIVVSFSSIRTLQEALATTARSIAGCRIDKRKRCPSTYQLLLDAKALGIGMPQEALA